MEKLTQMVDLPQTVRVDETLRHKLEVIRSLVPGGRNLAQQIRHSLTLGVDQEFVALGKEAIELLCRQMQATSAPKIEIPAPTPVSANVGSRRQMQARRSA